MINAIMGNELTYNWQIKGHAGQLSLLEKAVKSKLLAHAYIFSGPQQVGKRTIAKRLAQFLLCENGSACETCVNCRTLSAGSNADFLEIVLNDAIKIEHIRDLSYKLSLKPYAGQYKIALIDNAHNLTTEAANALLKVLEEPKPHTMMILITDNAYRLLPTITSRAQKISFGPVADQEFASWLESVGIPDPDPTFAGRPGYAIDVSNNDDVKNWHTESKDFFQRFDSGSLGDKLLLAAELSEKESSDLKKLFDSWLHRLERKMRDNPTLGLAHKIKSLTRAQRHLDQNVNSKLLLSELMVFSN